MLAGLVMFIIMGIVGGTHEVRMTVMPISLTVFLLGIVSFMYSKWIEQGTIRESALFVRRVLEEEVNPRHGDGAARIKYTVGVHLRELKTAFKSKTFLERPIVTIWCLRSLNAAGKMTDWELPDAIAHSSSVTIRHSHSLAHGILHQNPGGLAGKLEHSEEH